MLIRFAQLVTALCFVAAIALAHALTDDAYVTALISVVLVVPGVLLTIAYAVDAQHVRLEATRDSDELARGILQKVRHGVEPSASVGAAQSSVTAWALRHREVVRRHLQNSDAWAARTHEIVERYLEKQARRGRPSFASQSGRNYESNTDRRKAA